MLVCALIFLLLYIIRIYHECEGRIEKSVPQDRRLSSLGKPRDAKWRSSKTDFSILSSHGYFFLLTTVFNYSFIYLFILK